MNIYRYYFTRKINTNSEIEIPKEIIEYLNLKINQNIKIYQKEDRLFIEHFNIKKADNTEEIGDSYKIKIPNEIRKTLCLRTNQTLRLFLIEDKICLKKSKDYREDFI